MTEMSSLQNIKFFVIVGRNDNDKKAGRKKPRICDYDDDVQVETMSRLKITNNRDAVTALTKDTTRDKSTCIKYSAFMSLVIVQHARRRTVCYL